MHYGDLTDTHTKTARKDKEIPVKQMAHYPTTPLTFIGFMREVCVCVCVCVCVSGACARTHQVHQHTHVFLGQPVEEVGRVAGQDLVVVQRGDGLDALLQLLQARLHALDLIANTSRVKLSSKTENNIIHRKTSG